MPYVVLESSCLVGFYTPNTPIRPFRPLFCCRVCSPAIIPFYKVRGKVENSPFLRNKYQCVSHELSLPICVKNTAVNNLLLLLTFSQVKHLEILIHKFIKYYYV